MRNPNNHRAPESTTTHRIIKPSKTTAATLAALPNATAAVAAAAVGTANTNAGADPPMGSPVSSSSRTSSSVDAFVHALDASRLCQDATPPDAEVSPVLLQGLVVDEPTLNFIARDHTHYVGIKPPPPPPLVPSSSSSGGDSLQLLLETSMCPIRMRIDGTTVEASQGEAPSPDEATGNGAEKCEVGLKVGPKVEEEVVVVTEAAEALLPPPTTTTTEKVECDEDDRPLFEALGLSRLEQESLSSSRTATPKNAPSRPVGRPRSHHVTTLSPYSTAPLAINGVMFTTLLCPVCQSYTANKLHWLQQHFKCCFAEAKRVEALAIEEAWRMRRRYDEEVQIAEQRREYQQQQRDALLRLTEDRTSALSVPATATIAATPPKSVPTSKAKLRAGSSTAATPTVVASPVTTTTGASKSEQADWLHPRIGRRITADEILRRTPVTIFDSRRFWATTVECTPALLRGEYQLQKYPRLAELVEYENRLRLMEQGKRARSEPSGPPAPLAPALRRETVATVPPRTSEKATNDGKMTVPAPSEELSTPFPAEMTRTVSQCL